MPHSQFTQYYFLVAVGTLQLAEGGHFVLVPTIFAKLFGPEGGMRVYSVGFGFVGIASIINFGVVDFLLIKLGYEGLIFLYGSFSLVSLLYLLIFFKSETVKLKKRGVQSSNPDTTDIVDT